MKILIFRTDPSIMNISSYNSQEIGLAKAYIALGHECDIVYYNGNRKTHVEKIDVEQGKTIKLYWWRGFSILNNGIFPGISKLIKQYDMIQVSEYYQWSSWFVYSHYGRQKKVYVYQGVYDADNSKKYQLRCKVMDPIMLNKRVLLETQIFTKSNLALESMRRRGFKKVKTVGVGLDISRFGISSNLILENKLFHREEGMFYLLYVGVLEERRNILFMLDIIKKVTEQMKNVRLVIVGKGQEEYFSKCRKKIRECGLEKYIIYKECMSQEELTSVYLDSDLFLLPTKYEIFGMVLLEAVSFGVPVITSYNGGASTIIQDEANGIIIKEFDVNKWCDSIIRCINRSNRNMTKREVQTNKMDKFSWENIAKQIMDTMAIL